MLSENLTSLSNRLAEYKHAGVEMSSEGVAAICAVIEQAAEDARALERTAIPTEAQNPPIHLSAAHRCRGLLVFDGGRP